MKQKNFIIGALFSLYSLLSANGSEPSFMIIGAQKSGTTSLHSNMIQHPYIESALRKEVHFFDWYRDHGIDWYLNCFPDLQDKSITGEATTNYLFMPHIPKKVYKKFPKMKLIILIRNPVDRAISQYKYAIRRGLKLPSFNKCIKNEFATLGKEKKFKKAEIVETSQFEYPKKPHDDLVEESIGQNFIEQGIYIKHIRNWLNYFPEDQILVLKFDDLIAEPKNIMDQIFQFLELEPYENINYGHFHSTKNIQVAIKPETKEFLKQFYKPYNIELENFLGRKLNWD